ncbi:MAG TPA: 2-oxoglutarate dehydrogenase complex dihydrolipoyllysine-residue succinyltransferase [Spirochaetia bacterium]|nr:2-oxoglutarate dehydrogenase complex dihydrolipoyllysine-residue succinyltransferase [Spirochaetia bacterium]
MKLEVKIPSVGESVTQGIISSWLKAEGELVQEGGDLLELETDKANVTVPAPATGVVSITVKAGTEVSIGQVVGFIDSDARASVTSAAASKPASTAPAAAARAPAPAPAPASTPAPAAPPLAAAPAAPRTPAPPPTAAPRTPAASAPRTAVEPPAPRPAVVLPPAVPGSPPTRTPMTSLRKRIAQRLLDAQHSTASLSTFNEVNMKNITDLRSRYREEFERIHGVRLGFTSFFVKAACRALAEFPMVNARIDGEDVVYFHTFDIGVAVSTDRGLVVPVVRGADRLSIAQLEAVIADLAARARDRKVLPDELAGGSFSITNGGVFGSLLSTPLLNYPQSAILGMHAIQKRPVVEETAGETIVIRPMMYVALSYDHRLIDGKEAVSFLRRVKELVEDPWRLLIEV